jgi:hypothetical protein
MKQSRLLEIIREEIANVLNEETNVTITNRRGETDVLPYNNSADKAEIDRLKKDSNITSIKTTSGQKIKEDQLNEAPIYDVSDMEGFKSTLDKFREEGVSKSKSLNLLLKKLEDEGTVDTNALSKEYGVDTATFNNQEIRKFLNRPEGEVFTDKKTGEELIDFTPYLDKANKPKGPRKKPEDSEFEPKEKTALPDSGVKKKEPKKSEPKAKEEPKKSEPKAKEEPKKSEPKAKEDSEEKANKAASTGKSKLDKISDNKDNLLKLQKQAEAKMKELADKRKNAKESEKDALMDELKKVNAIKGEIDKKLNNLGY